MTVQVTKHQDGTQGFRIQRMHVGYFQIHMPEARQFPLSLAGLRRQMLLDLLETLAVTGGKNHRYVTGQKKEAVPAGSTGQDQRWRAVSGECDFLHVFRA